MPSWSPWVLADHRTKPLHDRSTVHRTGISRRPVRLRPAFERKTGRRLLVLMIAAFILRGVYYPRTRLPSRRANARCASWRRFGSGRTGTRVGRSVRRTLSDPSVHEPLEDVIPAAFSRLGALSPPVCPQPSVSRRQSSDALLFSLWLAFPTFRARALSGAIPLVPNRVRSSGNASERTWPSALLTMLLDSAAWQASPPCAHFLSPALSQSYSDPAELMCLSAAPTSSVPATSPTVSTPLTHLTALSAGCLEHKAAELSIQKMERLATEGDPRV